jgi:hypothetical protein
MTGQAFPPGAMKAVFARDGFVLVHACLYDLECLTVRAAWRRRRTAFEQWRRGLARRRSEVKNTPSILLTSVEMHRLPRWLYDMEQKISLARYFVPAKTGPAGAAGPRPPAFAGAALWEGTTRRRRLTSFSRFFRSRSSVTALSSAIAAWTARISSSGRPLQDFVAWMADRVMSRTLSIEPRAMAIWARSDRQAITSRACSAMELARPKGKPRGHPSQLQD